MIDVHERWEELLTVALLGTDRRDPPTGDSPIDELVADGQRPTAAGRMLAQAAACVAVRRAAMQPAPALAPLVPAEADPLPPCPRAAVARWRHLVASWPVLEDEWIATVSHRGWKLAPELVPTLLLRHRKDPVRLARVCAGAGPVAAWLADVDDRLAGVLDGVADVLDGVVDAGAEIDRAVGAGEVGGPLDPVLPPLPIPPELDALRTAEPAVIAESLLVGLQSGAFAAAHRPVLVNLVARLPASTLPAVIAALESIDPIEPCAPIASSLGDLARTRRAMLDELGRGA